MPVETATHIADLVPSNPLSSDGVLEGDDHLRLMKQVLQNALPGNTAPLTFAGDITLTGTGVFNGVQVSLTGDVIADKGAFSGNVNGVDGVFTGTVSGATATFGAYGDIVATTLGVSGLSSLADITGDELTLTDDVNAVNGVFSGNVSGVVGAFTGDVSGNNANFNNYGVVSATGLTVSGVSELTGITGATLDLTGNLTQTGGSTTLVNATINGAAVVNGNASATGTLGISGKSTLADVQADSVAVGKASATAGYGVDVQDDGVRSTDAGNIKLSYMAPGIFVAQNNVVGATNVPGYFMDPLFLSQRVQFNWVQDNGGEQMQYNISFLTGPPSSPSNGSTVQTYIDPQGGAAAVTQIWRNDDLLIGYLGDDGVTLDKGLYMAFDSADYALINAAAVAKSVDAGIIVDDDRPSISTEGSPTIPAGTNKIDVAKLLINIINALP